MPKMVLRLGGYPVREYALRPGCNRVGRAPGNEVVVEDATISGQHCEVWVLEESIVVRDLGSTNGTFLDARPVAEVTIEAGQLLMLGRVEFTFKDLPARVAIPVAPAPAPAPPTELPDGTPCCRNHPGTSAVFQCVKCAGQFCPPCVRVLSRVGGKKMVFCPSCGGQCGRIAGVKSRRRAQAGPGWLNRIAQTLRISKKDTAPRPPDEG